MTNQTARKINYRQEEALNLYAEHNKIEIQAMIQQCAKLITPVWPLETFIACNPLHGFESMPFEEAIICSQALLKKTGNNEQLKAVNLQMIKWCGAFLDAGQGTINLPHRHKGFYFGFLKLAPFDKLLHQNKKERKDWLLALPESAEQAITLCLNDLGITKDKRESFIQETLFYLPGWAGFIKWRSEWRNHTDTESKPVNLIDFLAVRLIITRLLWPQAATKKKDFLAPSIIESLKRNEDDYRHRLLPKLLSQLKKSTAEHKRSDVQLIFCIDVRSEPFRRAIESLGNYETLGFAGFFGLPIRVKDYNTLQTKEACPVLLKPRFNIEEKPLSNNTGYVKRHQKILAIFNGLKTVYQQLKYNFSTPFALAESLGIWCGVSMLFKSIITSAHLHRCLSTLLKPTIETEPCCDSGEYHCQNGIALNDQVAYAHIILKLMGMTQHFAKIIIFCGHGSSTTNNPYASALDCGACGGNQGGTNAQLLAQILNKPMVRKKLEEEGIYIPSDTVFFGAQHDTTTDSVKIYYVNEKPSPYPTLLYQLINDLKKATAQNQKERGQHLTGFNTPKTIANRSIDWSETRPEWGLARNAAFIIAPRFLTKQLNLDGRCFLHSYRWEEDTDGSLLETILTAPMVVAQWINTQYLFSTTDNVLYGSGSKITHNVIGRFGIVQGNGSDLMHGLPLQSVMLDDKTPYHCPQRLLTIVYAKRAAVKEIIDKQSILKLLFFNEWVHLVVIDPIDNLSYKLGLDGKWNLTR